MSVFIGLVSVPGREAYREQSRQGIAEHLMDTGLVSGEGWVCKPRSVAKNKNELLRLGLDSEADWIFIGEDDIVPLDSWAIIGYLRAAEASGWDHLSFAHHGPLNASGPVGRDPSGTVEYYPHYVGAWCLYSRRSLETCGLLDEHFVNSWDHVEHTLRLALAGFHPLPPEPYELRAADAVGSRQWLAEIPGSIKNTAIPHTPQWQADRVNGRKYWRETYPESYFLVFSR